MKQSRIQRTRHLAKYLVYIFHLFLVSDRRKFLVFSVNADFNLQNTSPPVLWDENNLD